MVNYYGCVAHPCDAKRKKKSAFCPTHHTEHENSEWVKAWRAYQAEIKRVGDYKQVLWAPPK